MKDEEHADPERFDPYASRNRAVDEEIERDPVSHEQSRRSDGADERVADDRCTHSGSTTSSVNPPRKIIYASIDPATTRVHLSIDFYPRRLKTDILLTLLGLKREGNVPCRRTSDDGGGHDEDG